MDSVLGTSIFIGAVALSLVRAREIKSAAQETKTALPKSVSTSSSSVPQEIRDELFSRISQ